MECASGAAFRGALTAVVTPFHPHRELDEQALRRLVEFQIDEDIDGIIACGSTGEAATLSVAEQRRVLEIAVFRPPLVPMSQPVRERLRACLERVGLGHGMS